CEPRDLFPERRPALDVEARRRLVEEENRRPVHERHRQVEPALHPARIAAHLAVGGTGKPDAVEELVRTRATVATRQRLQRRLQTEVLPTGEERVERRFLKSGTDA